MLSEARWCHDKNAVLLLYHCRPSFLMQSIPALFYFIFLVSSLVVRVAAHGFVHSVVIDGKEYQGWNPFSDPYNDPAPRATRKVGSDGFVADSDADLACHHGGDEGTTVLAEAPAGGKVTFNWAYWPGDHQGPISTYMASCSGDCSSFSANSAKWFKIDANGYSASDRQWAAAKLIAAQSSWTSTIPSNLAPGQYLLRNEIIALHSVTPQFYPSCIQVEVTGSGSGYPSSDDLATMQEVYGGASWPNIYLSLNLDSYQVPGPAVARLDGSKPGSQPVQSTTRRASTAAAPSQTGTSAPTQQTGGQCVLSRRRFVRRKV